MNVLFKYNVDFSDIENGFPFLYEKRRRDSCFAIAYEENGTVTALRDHLGVVALYYRYVNNGIKFSNNLSDLIQKTDKVNQKGVKYFLAFKTAKIYSPFENIHLVPPGSVIKIDLKTKDVKCEYRYEFKKLKLANYSLVNLVGALDELFINAVRRTVKYKTVGLYLSGGMDSALTGIYLKKLGIKVNAYTLLPWGKSGSETKYAEINSKVIGVDSHKFVSMNSANYDDLISKVGILYKGPQGDSAPLGITQLWMSSSISKEDQVYGAQNADTMTCSMQAQYYSYFLNFLPLWLKKE